MACAVYVKSAYISNYMETFFFRNEILIRLVCSATAKFEECKPTHHQNTVELHGHIELKWIKIRGEVLVLNFRNNGI